MSDDRRRRRGGALLVLLIAATPSVAVAAPPFRTRAVGHVFRCGARVIEIDRDGGATLSTAGAPTVLPAAEPAWSADRVRLSFGKPAGVVTLSEFGSTVSAKAADGSSVCVTVR